MTEDRESLIQELQAIRGELASVLYWEQQLQVLSRQLRSEKKTFESTTIRAKWNQVLAAMCVAMPGICAVESLIRFQFDQVGVFVFVTFLVYKMLGPGLYQDRKLNIFRIGLSLLSIWLVGYFVVEYWRVMIRPSVLSIVYAVVMIVVYAVIAVIVYRLLTKKRLGENTQIAAENKAIQARNNQLRSEYSAAQEQLNRHGQAVQDLCAGWFPMDYCYEYAIDCFIRYLKNYQADTLKELVNLFENEEHQRRMEEGQRETQRQIQYMNLTNIMNNWSLQNTINQNARNIQDTINQSARNIQDTINSSIRNRR